MMGVGVGWVTQVIECFDFRLWVPMRAAVAGGTVMLGAQRFSGVFPHSLPPPSLAPPGERGSQQPYVAAWWKQLSSCGEGNLIEAANRLIGSAQRHPTNPTEPSWLVSGYAFG